MRSFRTTTSPFKKKEVYTDADFESICTDALKSADVYPTEPSPVRIERLIEKRFGIVPEFDNLNQYGAIGVTIFGSNGPTDIVIDTQLAEQDKTTRSRYLSTLAHEAGHCLLHSHLFALHARKGSVACPCRQKDGKYSGEWWEFQANRAIGSLLLPEFIFREYLKNLGVRKLEDVTDDIVESAADIFGVNKPVVRIRTTNFRF